MVECKSRNESTTHVEGDKNHKKGGLNCVFQKTSFLSRSRTVLRFRV